MESKGNRTIEGIRFESEKEYEAACKELETIREIERKFAIGDPKIALSIYNKAVSKKSFKTIIGYMFMKRLRDTIVSCGLVDSESLYPVPVVKEQADSNSAHLNVKDNKYQILYRDEKKKRKVAVMFSLALVIVIAVMFFMTGSSKYSYVTYFTDYENDIRNEIIDEYEQWEKELTEREEALSKGYVKE